MSFLEGKVFLHVLKGKYFTHSCLEGKVFLLVPCSLFFDGGSFSPKRGTTLQTCGKRARNLQMCFHHQYHVESEVVTRCSHLQCNHRCLGEGTSLELGARPPAVLTGEGRKFPSFANIFESDGFAVFSEYFTFVERN